LSGGIGASVYALAAIGSDLYVGGSFSTIAGLLMRGIAKWNGTSWSALGSGMDGSVHALAVSGTDVYAGGLFTTAGGVNASRIAKWSGTSWSALGSGMDAKVSVLAVNSTELYAGGSFTTAGEKPSEFIAQWHISHVAGIIETTPTIPTRYALMQNFPNPFNPTTIIAYELPTSSYVTSSVFDLLGRHVRDLVSQNLVAGSYEVEFSATGLASGVYFYRFSAGQYTITKRFLLLR
jgi:hypothetical protein